MKRRYPTQEELKLIQRHLSTFPEQGQEQIKKFTHTVTVTRVFHKTEKGEWLVEDK